jgi:quercetin dioxygenase-like cupin family protein
MQSWNLKAPPESDKRGRRELCSTAATRMEVIDLDQNEELEDHGNGGRLVIEVLSGSVDLTIGGHATTCGGGMLVALEPGESRSVRALESSRLLLTRDPSRLLLTFTARPAARGNSPRPR